MIGEVGLAGDLRRVTGMERRLAEAARLGFTSAIVRTGHQDPCPNGLRTLEVATIGAGTQGDADHRGSPRQQTP